jgi:AraC-like DNA-binding protein
MAEFGAYGNKLGGYLHLDDVPALVARTTDKKPIAITRCRLDTPAHGPTSPIPSEDAYMVVLQTGESSHRELWLDGKPVRTEPLNPGQVALHDLRRRPVFKIYTPINSVNFYIPRQALDACADDANARWIGDLAFTPGIGVDDRVLAALGSAVLPAFKYPDQVNQLFIDSVTRAVVAHVAQSLGGMQASARPLRGGLAPWQERRAKEVMDANLDGEISLGELANHCGLSISHFSRAFRQSTGTSPHRWLLNQRVEKAKRLLRDRQSPLSEVALACGFADQSHLTRVFTKLSGAGPAAWRRVHQE